MSGEEEDVGCGSLDALLVAGEDAIEDVGGGDEEAEDGNDGDIGSKDMIAEELKTRGSETREEKEGGRRQR